MHLLGSSGQYYKHYSKIYKDTSIEETRIYIQFNDLLSMITETMISINATKAYTSILEYCRSSYSLLLIIATHPCNQTTIHSYIYGNSHKSLKYIR